MGAVRGAARVCEVFRRLREATPAPTTELAYGNGFQLLVAVVLSAQMTDKGVNKATGPLFARVETPAEMVALGEEALVGYVKSINYYRAKARNVMKLVQALVDDFGGEVPRTREDLESLAGVGRKTANVVLNTLYGEPTMAVDTHVFRVAKRLGFSKGRTPAAVEQDLVRIVPAEFARHAHHWLILHGRYTCTARSPKCATCCVRDVCLWKDKAV